MQTVKKEVLEQLFTEAHTEHKFNNRVVENRVLQTLYDIAKFGPTGFNSQPARFLFITSYDAKAKLASALSSSNKEKTLFAPVNVVIAYDLEFYENLSEQFPAYDAKKFFLDAPDWIEPTAKLNATLQAGFFIIAARALGLSVGPMSGFNPNLIDSLFFPDKKFKSFLLLNLGYIDASVAKRGPRLTFEQVAKII